jgi:hypothetical protein
MPTRLGNVFKSAELYPALRYGMDGALFWPRLYAILPDRVAAGLAEARSTVERLLTLSWLSGIFAITTSTYLLVAHGPWLLYLCCLLGGLLIAYACYLAAIRAADGYTERVRAAFDVYRRELAVKLDGESATLDRAQWKAVGQFWFRGLPPETQVLPEEPTQPELARTRSRWRPTVSMSCAPLIAIAAVAGCLWLK